MRANGAEAECHPVASAVRATTCAGADDPGEALHLVPYDAVYVGRDRVWVQPAAGPPLEASARLMRALRTIGPVAGLDAMTDAVARSLGVPAGHVDAARRELERFARQGLLISGAELVRRCVASAPSGVLGLELVSVPTCQRPEGLERCLHSYLGPAGRFERRLEFSILDDARTAKEAARTRALLARFARRGGCGVRHAGVEEKRAYAALLSRRLGGGRDEVAFLLFGADGAGCSVGANRNAQLLDAVGRRYLSVDDDTVGAASASSRDKGVLLTSALDPTEVRLFADRQEACADAGECAADLIGEHDATLGRTVSELIGACAPRDLAMVAPSPRLMRSVLSGRGVVRATSSGTYGDAGAANPEYHVLRDDVRSQLVTDEGRFHTLVRTRETARGVPRVTVTDSAYCQGGALALDARTLLPPFFPVLRGEDVVWGTTLRACFDEAFIAHLPCAVLHTPVEDRAPDALRDGAALRPWPSYMYLLSAFDSFRASGEGVDRLRALGHHAQGLGGLGERDFAELVHRALWLRATRLLGELEAQLVRHHGQPRFWAQLVEGRCRELGAFVRSPEFLHPGDAPAGLSSSDALRWLQGLLSRWGKALVAWPEIWTAASKLADDGVRLTAPILT